MMRKVLLLVLSALALLSSCKSQYDILLESNDADAKYEAAFDYFNRGKFQKSAELFESLAFLTSGTEREDTVRYYWGLSNYRGKDYYTAETNFKNFVETFPRSPFAPEARFLRIECLYSTTLRWELDQTPSNLTLAAIAEYLTDYPLTEHYDECVKIMDDLGERQDRKAFENARLYYKMEDYKAARVAFRNVLKDDADNIYREEILYYTAMSSYKFAQMSVPEKQRERMLIFFDDYLNFIGEYPESVHRHELDTIYKRAQKR
ncbi:MAG: outer membrane protein assembly factor BamD [Bacteroidales bacterium]|nr:outer membrane protein assembly factor BamD [Bacteroidales bacterium]